LSPCRKKYLAGDGGGSSGAFLSLDDSIETKQHVLLVALPGAFSAGKVSSFVYLPGVDITAMLQREKSSWKE